MWNDHDGLYEDYDFMHRKTRYYPFLTTFYPLWAGIAEPGTGKTRYGESAAVRADRRTADER